MERLLKLGFFVALVLYFLSTVIMMAPAQWVASIATKSVPGLHMSGVSGTVWTGKAAGASYNYMGNHINLGSLDWDASLLSLLGLKVCAKIESPVVRGNVCHGLAGTTEFKTLMVDNLPASLFNKYLGLATLGGNGSAAVRHAKVAKDGSVKQLDGSVSWRDARVNAGDGWFNLGSFAADLGPGDDGGIKFKLFDLEGAFGIDISGAFGYRGELSLNGTVAPKENAPPQLVDALSAFTETLDDGTFKVTWPMGG